MNEIQEAFEKASLEPYGVKNHLPEIWKIQEKKEGEEVEWERRMFLIEVISNGWNKINNLLKK